MTKKECRELRKILADLGSRYIFCLGTISNLPKGDPRIMVEQAKADSFTISIELLETKLMELTQDKLYWWDERVH